jgi:DNA-binding CsgD family transcriptional regulator
VALIAVQALCALFFIGDLIADARELGTGPAGEIHLSFESFATLSLIVAIGFEVAYLRKLLRRKAHLEHSLLVASTAVHDVIEAHFDDWRLSPSERDVAMFLVKGLNTAEIAGMRGCAEGTVKTHLNAIYRKSGTRSRGELLSVIIDSLMAGGGRDAAGIRSAVDAASRDRMPA